MFFIAFGRFDLFGFIFANIINYILSLYSILNTIFYGLKII